MLGSHSDIRAISSMLHIFSHFKQFIGVLDPLKTATALSVSP